MHPWVSHLESGGLSYACMIGSEQPLWRGPVIPQHPGTRRIVTQNTLQGPSLTEEYIMHLKSM